MVINTYGPTEAAIAVSFYNIYISNEINKLLTIPIGSTVYNTDLSIINNDGYILNQYERGILFISGKQFGGGYYKRKRKTAISFTPIFDTNNSIDVAERNYNTGDEVYINSDNYIEYLGRIDSQDKRNGQRMEVEEVAHCFTKE